MKFLVWPFRLFILLVLVWFSVKNSQPVVLSAYPYTWEAPLVLVILAFFGGGVLLGLLAALGTIYRLKRELGALRKDIRARDNAAQKLPLPDTLQSPGTGDHGV
jgi:lipopolysaccharide assembly protein A